MDFSSLLVILFVGLFVSILISWSIISSLRPQALSSLSPSSGSLNSPTKIGSSGNSRDLFLIPPGATLSVFVFYAVNNRTSSVGSTQTPVNLLKLGNALQLQILPGGVSTSPKTQLVIKTQAPNGGSTNEISPEIISVNDFPQQQWVHLAIVREGRRFTVYYNGKIAGSDRTKYVPVVNSSDFIIGDTRLNGEFGLPKLAPTPYSQSDLQADLLVTADTRHQPYLPMNFWMTLSSVFTFGCPNGLFCFSTSSPPHLNPLKTWTTPYA